MKQSMPSDRARRAGKSPYHEAGLRYGSALAFVGIALGLSLLIQPLVPHAFLILFLSAVMLAGWFSRTGAGLLAVVISTVAVDYYFIAPQQAFLIEVDELPYFLTFLASAVVTSWLGSARRSAEDRQKAYLDELFEQTPEAIMLVDLEDRVLRVNKRFLRIFGYTIEESINRTSADLIVPVHLISDVRAARERLSEGHDVNVETLRRCKNGDVLSVSEISFPVVANGRHIATYVILRDITENKRALDVLQRTQAELARFARVTVMGELAASIAHEINQPLGAIVTNGNAGLRWLQRTPPHLEGIANALNGIVRDGNRAAEVVARIRSLLRKNRPSMAPVGINELIREVVLLVAQETKNRNVEVKTELSPTLPPVLGDRVQLQQVLLNLIMNGLDAMAGVTNRPRQLRIGSFIQGDFVTVQVEDSGQGWEAEDPSILFDAFFTTKEDGIGMGLAISRSIIETHGGLLSAERGKPHGAVLTFTVPQMEN